MTNLTKSKFKTVVLSASVTIMAISLILFPKESLEASKSGLNMWWGIVFPSLLPFFIVSEMLIGIGVVKFIGVLLEPLMRPLFRVPGVGGFVWAMGMASGYPAGAKLTARLREEKQITAIEAERLVSFTNSSNPLFIFGAISVGFFHNPEIGIVLALSHYLGNLCVGILMRFHGGNEHKLERGRNKKHKIYEAFYTLHKTRIKDNRPIGKLLGDAVTSSIHTLLMIGGFIILFSVFNRLLGVVNITTSIALVFQHVLTIFSLPENLTIPLISGLFEITLGGKLTSQTENVSLLHQVIVTSFILAFSGFSVQAQVASILADTDIRFKPFFIARVIHGFFAALFTVLLWKGLYHAETSNVNDIIPVSFIHQPPDWLYQYFLITVKYGPLFTICSLIVYLLIYIKRLPQK